MPRPAFKYGAIFTSTGVTTWIMRAIPKATQTWKALVVAQFPGSSQPSTSGSRAGTIKMQVNKADVCEFTLAEVWLGDRGPSCMVVPFGLDGISFDGTQEVRVLLAGEGIYRRWSATLIGEEA